MSATNGLSADNKKISWISSVLRSCKRRMEERSWMVKKKKKNEEDINNFIYVGSY